MTLFLNKISSGWRCPMGVHFRIHWRIRCEESTKLCFRHSCGLSVYVQHISHQHDSTVQPCWMLVGQILGVPERRVLLWRDHLSNIIISSKIVTSVVGIRWFKSAKCWILDNITTLLGKMLMVHPISL